jgi:flagellin
MNSYRNFGVNNSKMSKNLEKLSSGYAINRAGDDAAGLAVSEKMRWQITGIEAATKNAKDGIGLVQTAEGALTEVHDMLNRMTYLSEQAANGTYTAGDRTNLKAEFTELANEIKRIGDTANFNGNALFKGATGGATKNINIVIDENGSKLTVKATSYMITGGTLQALSQASKLTNTSTDTILEVVTQLKEDIKSVASWRAELGATQNRLEHTVNNLGVMRENITDAESRIRDTDVAEEMMKFTKNSIMNQAAQAMLAQSNQLPQGVLQLLQ